MSIAPSASTASWTVSNTGTPRTFSPSLARRHAADDLRAVIAASAAWRHPLAAGDALHDHALRFVDNDRHENLRASATDGAPMNTDEIQMRNAHRRGAETAEVRLTRAPPRVSAPLR